MLISIPSVLCGDDGLSGLIAASYDRYGKRMGEEKECRHLESCLTEYPIITVESMTSFLFFSISVITNNMDPLSVENLVRKISFGRKMRLPNPRPPLPHPYPASTREGNVTLIWLSMCSFLVNLSAVKRPCTHCTALNAWFSNVMAPQLLLFSQRGCLLLVKAIKGC